VLTGHGNSGFVPVGATDGLPWRFEHSVRYADADALLGLCRTYSYLNNALTAGQFDRFGDDVRALVQSAHGGGPFELPYVTKLYGLKNTKRADGGPSRADAQRGGAEIRRGVAVRTA